MKKHILRLLLLPLLFVSSCTDRPEPAELVRVGDLLPAFTVQLSDGTLLDSSDLRPGLIVFFHTGCPDCRQVLPAVQQVYDIYKEDIRFVAISRAQPDAADYWQQNGLSIPLSAQPDRSLYDRFARSGIPRIYVVDASGRIAALFDDNPVPTTENLFEIIKKCI